jgi:hypothetical protein
MAKTPVRIIHVQLPEALKEILEDLARSERKPLSEYIREILATHICRPDLAEMNKRQPMRPKGEPCTYLP